MSLSSAGILGRHQELRRLAGWVIQHAQALCVQQLDPYCGLDPSLCRDAQLLFSPNFVRCQWSTMDLTTSLTVVGATGTGSILRTPPPVWLATQAPPANVVLRFGTAPVTLRRSTTRQTPTFLANIHGARLRNFAWILKRAEWLSRIVFLNLVQRAILVSDSLACTHYLPQKNEGSCNLKWPPARRCDWPTWNSCSDDACNTDSCCLDRGILFRYLDNGLGDGRRTGALGQFELSLELSFEHIVSRTVLSNCRTDSPRCNSLHSTIRPEGQ